MKRKPHILIRLAITLLVGVAAFVLIRFLNSGSGLSSC